MGSTVSVSLYFSIKREMASVEIPLPIFVQLFRISLKTHHPCTCYRDRTMSPDDWPQGIDNFDLGKSLSEGVETIQSTPLLSTIFRPDATTAFSYYPIEKSYNLYLRRESIV